MTGNNGAPGRAAMLARAIDLCTELRDMVDQIAPSRFTRSSDYVAVDDYEAIQQVFELENLLQRRLQELNGKRNAALSPVSRLTDDVLRLIFRYAHESRRADKSAQHMRCDYDVPIALSHVSQRWRTLALNMAVLWTYLRFGYRRNRSYGQRSFAESPPSAPERSLTKLYLSNLARAKMAPLIVYLKLRPWSGLSTVMKDYSSICSDRVTELTISVEPYKVDVLAPLAKCIADTRVSLRRLTIRVKGFGGHEVDPAKTLESVLSLDMPQLEVVELSNVSLPTAANASFVGLSQCRSLYLSPVYGQSPFEFGPLVNLLRCMPLLEELRLSHRGVAQSAPMPLARLSIPTLRRLCCPFTSTESGGAFGHLAVPNLEKLAIDNFNRMYSSTANDPNTSYLQNIFGFLRASSTVPHASPKIRELSITIGTLIEATELLRQFPSLEKLIVAPEGLQGRHLAYVDLLKGMGKPYNSLSSCKSEVSGQSALLCPKLHTLSIRSCATAPHVRALTEMAARRSAAGFRLGCIKLQGWVGDESDDSELAYDATGPPTRALPPKEQRALECALAREVDSLECGGYRWDWSEGGIWRRKGPASDGILDPADWLQSTFWR